MGIGLLAAFLAALISPLAGPRQPRLDFEAIIAIIIATIGAERLLTTYSVADAKNGLPRLIDRALEGEEVVISRHGKPVVELRPVMAAAATGPARTYDWLKARRQARKSAGVTSVELLRQIYEDPGA